MSHNISKKENRNDKPKIFFGGFFVFCKSTYKKVYRVIARKRAQGRVQKMLKNNLVNLEIEQNISKNAKKTKKNVKIVKLSPQFPKMGLSKGLRGVAGVFSVLFLMLTMVTSQYYGLKITEAEILVQNFTETEVEVTEGTNILKYQNRSQNGKDNKSEFDTGNYTNGNFETGEDDLLATNTVDDYLGLNNYGGNGPDTSSSDWWDDDSDTSTMYNWIYRRCFDVDNSAVGSTSETEYQVYLDIDTATLVTAGKMQVDGDDMRFVDVDGNLLDYFIADDINTSSTRVWVQMDDITASTSEEVCMYYGNATATGVSSRTNVFTYSAQEEIYHVVADTAEVSITEFASYTDSNSISVSGYTGTLNQYEHSQYPASLLSLAQTTAISTTDPINGSYRQDGTDNLVPASFAGENFVYRMDRYTNQFSFISPWCSANVEVRNESGTIVTNGSFTITQGTAHNLTTNNTAATGIANDSAVIIEVTNGCPILAQHHSDAGGDSFVMAPAAQEWYGVGSGNLEIAALYDTTNVTLYRSNGTTASYTLNRGDNVYISDAGSEGSEPAHRVVADNLIGVKAIADTDGGEAVTFLPVEDLGYKYYFPEDIQYIAIATKENTTTTVNLYHDGTACGVGTPDDTATVTAAATYPGKVYFGSTTDGTNIPAGACVVADNPVFSYHEFATTNDEHNAWNEKQNRQFVGPEPTYSVGGEELGNWSIDGTNNWTRRTPVTVTNNSTTGLTEYQILLDLGNDVSHMFGHTQTDGGDIRVAGSTGNGTDNLVYALEDFSDTNSDGDLWVQVPTITASSTAIFYIYYNPGIDFGASYSPLIWLDAADTSTITHTAGEVSQWDDKSGNANHVDQSNNNNKPTLTTDGGNQVLFFDASGDYLENSPGLWVRKTTYTDTYAFVVFKDLDTTIDGTLFNEAIKSGNHEALAPDVSGGTDITFQANSNNPTGAVSGTYGGDTTTYHAMRFEAHSGGNRIIARDGTTIASDTSGTSFEGANSTFNVGSRAGGAQAKYMNIGELMVFNGTLTSTEVTGIEQYLLEKWQTGPTSTLTTTGDYNAIFHTSTRKPNYYVVDERAVDQVLTVISFADGNSINDSLDTITLDEGEMTSIPVGGIKQIDSYSVTGPIHADFNRDATDSALPISYAGTEFTYMIDRYSDVFSFYAPFADAIIQIQESSTSGWTTLQTLTLTAGSTQTIAQDITNGSAFKIISDEPILAFSQASNYDSRTLYPTHLGLEEDSGNYELYGVASDDLLLGASSDANVTIYRSDGTSTSVTLNAANNFAYGEVSAGVQGTSVGYHIVSDAPIGATSRGDADGYDAMVFLSQKEFSRDYVLSQPTQYMAVVARDANVTCRVYDDTGAEITTDGTGTMDNIPPQTGGTQTLPYPNNIHIGGDDTTDGAYFDAGYHMTCTEPVFAYYERHLGGDISDETNWLTWPQVRKRAHIEPTIEDVDTVNEQGLFYESGRDSGGAGTDFEAYAEYTLDTSALTFGEHTYWRDITWEEISNSRSSLNGVSQVRVEVASADPSPDCASATYGPYTVTTPTTLASSVDSSLPYVTYTTSTKQILFDDDFSDHSCVRMRVYVLTGDEAYTPKINNIETGYYIPTVLDGQLSNPTISVEGATSGSSERYRVFKAITSDTGLNGSQAFTTYAGSSNEGSFTQADLDLYEIPTDTINAQFAFPPFPASTPVDSATDSPFDASNDVAGYFTHEHTSTTSETMDFIFNIDMNGAGGPQISRDFQLNISN